MINETMMKKKDFLQKNDLSRREKTKQKPIVAITVFIIGRDEQEDAVNSCRKNFQDEKSVLGMEIEIVRAVWQFFCWLEAQAKKRIGGQTMKKHNSIEIPNYGIFWKQADPFFQSNSVLK